jgi:hypothetical protein
MMEPKSLRRASRLSRTKVAVSLFVVAIMVLSGLAVLTSVGVLTPVTAAPAVGAGSASTPTPTPASTAQPALVAPTSSAATQPTPNLANLKIKPPVNMQSVIPQSWGGAQAPPGAPIPSVLNTAVQNAASQGNWQQEQYFLNNWCDGLWPINNAAGGAQGAYIPGCYGHDEPAVNPYSNLPGSGGNVTWNITLPIDRSATQNQSDLYAAIWFGLTLHDPQGWMSQCFLELQFYPDSSFYVPTGTVAGQWVAAAVGWQIDLANGFEDPCYYSPLYTNVTTASFLNMTQGDSIQVQMSGWVGSPWGENVTVRDMTNGQVAKVNLLYNQGGANEGKPLDPAYVANDVPGSLQWTPGGELPISFSFETGHAGNPSFPNSNQYGGCSAGLPSIVPSAPCPSYDPGSWANDSLQPWVIAPPTFNSSAGHMVPTQVAFTQPEGALNLIEQTSLGTCAPGGSQWCTYPWYGWYPSATGGTNTVPGAFEFGATNYPGVYTDFGQAYNEFQEQVYTPADGLGFYYPNFFPIPDPSTAVAVSIPTVTGPATSSITIVNETVAGGSAGAHDLELQPGVYSALANNVTGYSFDGWTVTGGVALAGPNTPMASFTVTGAGSITAKFVVQTTAPTTTVTFTSNNPKLYTWTGVSLGEVLGAQNMPVAQGASIALTPGIYMVQAMPGPGVLFDSWNTSIGNVGSYLTQGAYPITLLVVGTAGGTATVEANYTGTSLTTTLTVQFTLPGSGTLNITGVPGTPSYMNLGSQAPVTVTLPVGSYNFTYMAAPGYALYTWSYYLGSIVVSNQSGLYLGTGLAATTASIQMTLEQGAAGLIVEPFAVTNVKLAVNLGGTPSATAGFVGIYAFASYVYSGTQLFVNAPNPYAVLNYPSYGPQTPSEFYGSAGNTLLFYDILGNNSWPIQAFPTLAGSAPTPKANGNPIFENWGMTGGPGAMVAQATAQSSMLMLNASAAVTTIDANFTATTSPLALTVNVGGLGAAYVNLNSTATTMTLEVPLAPSIGWPIFAQPATGSTFVGWSTTGGVSVAGGEVFVSGTGSLSANFIPSPTTSVPAAIDFIASNPATASFTLGAQTFTTGTVLPLVVGNTYTVSGTLTAGTALGWNVSDNGAFTGVTSTPSSITFTVAGAGTIYWLTTQTLAVAPLTIVNNAIDLSMPTTITATAVGAGSSATYAYTGLPAGCSGTTPTITCTPTAAGVSSVTVTVTSGGSSATSSAVPLTVAALPSATIGFTGYPKMNGFPLTIWANVTGGTGPYTYTYTKLPSGCTSADTAQLVCTPAAGGPTVVNVTITDTYGFSAKASTTVNIHSTSVTITSQPSGIYEYSGVINMPLSWNTTVTTPSDLSILTEVITLCTAFASGAPLCYQATGTPNLVYSPPAATESTTFTAASDLALPQQSLQLPYGVFTLTITAYNASTGLTIASASVTVVHSEAPTVGPANGAVLTAGNVTLSYSYVRPFVSAATLDLFRVGTAKAIFTESIVSPTGYGTGSVAVPLAPGSYVLNVSTLSSATGTYENVSSAFTVIASASGGTVYFNKTDTVNNFNNATLSVGGLQPRVLGAILIVVGIIVGLIVGLAVAMLTRPKSGAAAPQAWQQTSGGSGQTSTPAGEQASTEEPPKTDQGSS